MKYFNYILLVLFALLIIPVLAMMAGAFMEKLMFANLFLQAIAFCMCAYGLATTREKEMHVLYGGYLLLIVIYYVIGAILATATIPQFG